MRFLFRAAMLGVLLAVAFFLIPFGLGILFFLFAFFTVCRLLFRGSRRRRAVTQIVDIDGNIHSRKQPFTIYIK